MIQDSGLKSACDPRRTVHLGDDHRIAVFLNMFLLWPTRLFDTFLLTSLLSASSSSMAAAPVYGVACRLPAQILMIGLELPDLLYLVLESREAVALCLPNGECTGFRSLPRDCGSVVTRPTCIRAQRHQLHQSTRRCRKTTSSIVGACKACMVIRKNNTANTTKLKTCCGFL